MELLGSSLPIYDIIKDMKSYKLTATYTNEPT